MIVDSDMLRTFSGTWPLATMIPSSIAATSSMPSVPMNGETIPRRCGACFISSFPQGKLLITTKASASFRTSPESRPNFAKSVRWVTWYPRARNPATIGSKMKFSSAGARETTVSCLLMPPCLPDQGGESIPLPKRAGAKLGKKSEPGQPRGLLPRAAGTGGFEVGLHLRKIGKADPGFFEHVEGRTVVAVDQREICAEHPLIGGKMKLDDLKRRGQGLLAAHNRGFIRRSARQFYRDPVERHLGGGRRNRAGQKKHPAQSVRPPRPRRRPQPPRLFAQIGEDRVRFPQRQVAIHQHRDPSIRIEREEFGRALLAL